MSDKWKARTPTGGKPGTEPPAGEAVVMVHSRTEEMFINVSNINQTNTNF